MKKINFSKLGLLSALVFILSSIFAFGQSPVAISALPAVGTPVGTDVLPVVNGGSTKKITLNQVKNFVGSYWNKSGSDLNYNAGNVAIGTTSALYKLDVVGDQHNSGGIYFGTGGQNLSQGTFDNGYGGNQGISLNCAVGYELNWQAGHLTASYGGGSGFIPVAIDSGLVVNKTFGYGINNPRYEFDVKLDSIIGSAWIGTKNSNGLLISSTDGGLTGIGDILNNGNKSLIGVLDTASYVVIQADEMKVFVGDPAEGGFIFLGNQDGSGSESNYIKIEDINDNIIVETGGLYLNASIHLSLPVYSDDAAAGAGGVITGQLYQSVSGGDGFVKIKQ